MSKTKNIFDDVIEANRKFLGYTKELIMLCDKAIKLNDRVTPEVQEEENQGSKVTVYGDWILCVEFIPENEDLIYPVYRVNGVIRMLKVFATGKITPTLPPGSIIVYQKITATLTPGPLFLIHKDDVIMRVRGAVPGDD